MANEERYSSIKKFVLEAVGDKYNLEKLKNYFKGDIDSPRTFKKIRTIEELIVVLEQRDVLNYSCPMPLFYIGNILKNDKIKDAITVYNRCYLQGQHVLCLCGEELDYRPSSASLQVEGNTFKTSYDRINFPNNDLMDAIKNVAEQIRYWRVLASELNVEEYVIDEIYEKYPKSEKMQALAAMQYWMDKGKENATIERLDKALNARLCQKKGIGSHLRNPLSCLS